MAPVPGEDHRCRTRGRPLLSRVWNQLPQTRPGSISKPLLPCTPGEIRTGLKSAWFHFELMGRIILPGGLHVQNKAWNWRKNNCWQNVVNVRQEEGFGESMYVVLSERKPTTFAQAVLGVMFMPVVYLQDFCIWNIMSLRVQLTDRIRIGNYLKTKVSGSMFVYKLAGCPFKCFQLNSNKFEVLTVGL